MKSLAAFPLKTTLALVLLSYVTVRYAPPPGSPGAPKEFSLGYGMHPDRIKAAEFYPLSSFPMYSKFSASPIYVYITDEKDSPIAHHRFDNMSTAIKKDFDRRLRQVKARIDVPMRDMTPEQKFPAGNAALKHVVANADPERLATIKAKSLRLYEVTLSLAKTGGIKESTELVGEITL